MEKRDYLLRQIQQMAQALTALIRKLTGIKDEYPEEQERLEQITNEMLRENFDFELNELMQIPIEEAGEWINKQKGIHVDNLELFAEILLLNAENHPDLNIKCNLLKMAICLLEYIDREGNIFSIERQSRIRKIKEEVAESE